MHRPTEIALRLMHRRPELGSISPLQLLETAGYPTDGLLAVLDAVAQRADKVGQAAAYVRQGLGQMDRPIEEIDLSEDREKLHQLFPMNAN